MFFYDTEAGCYRKNECTHYTARELIDIFPGAKEIIPAKIKEWKREKRRIYKSHQVLIDKIIASKNCWFWERAFEVMAVKESNKQLARLESFLFMTSPKGKKAEYDKDRAKLTPILEMFRFERVRRVGGRTTAKCPLHSEKTGSFVIYADNTFYCFGCHQGGDAIKFKMLLTGCDFKEAIS